MCQCQYVHVFPVRGLILRPRADTYEVRNAAQGPHKGSKFVSTETGAPGVGRLRRRHRVKTMTDALKFLGLQSNVVQTRSIGTRRSIIVDHRKHMCCLFMR